MTFPHPSFLVGGQNFAFHGRHRRFGWLGQRSILRMRSETRSVLISVKPFISSGPE
jgi:hypothetical protein